MIVCDRCKQPGEAVQYVAVEIHHNTTVGTDPKVKYQLDACPRCMDVLLEFVKKSVADFRVNETRSEARIMAKPHE